MVFKFNTNYAIRLYKFSGQKLLLSWSSKDVFWYMKIAGKHSVVHGCLVTHLLFNKRIVPVIENISNSSFVWCIRLDRPGSAMMVFKLNTNYAIRLYKCSSKNFCYIVRKKMFYDIWRYMEIIQLFMVVNLRTYCLTKELYHLQKTHLIVHIFDVLDYISLYLFLWFSNSIQIMPSYFSSVPLRTFAILFFERCFMIYEDIWKTFSCSWLLIYSFIV